MEIKQKIPAEACFRYMEGLEFPFQYHPDFARWEDSFLRDVDGEGRTLFLYKHHGGKTELFHLAPAERAKFLEEMTLVAQAVSRAFQAEKMNYELLGMGDAHLHWHLFPRRAGDIGGKGPVWWYPMEKMYGDENRPSAGELAEMKQKLQTELDLVLGPDTAGKI